MSAYKLTKVKSRNINICYFKNRKLRFSFFHPWCLIDKNHCLSEPSAPPSSVQGYNSSSTSIFVSWGEVPRPDQNGVILNYTVTYHTLPSGPERTKTVIAPTTNITLGDLNEFTEYSITVFSSTIKGGGTTSAAIIVRTDEDSKYTTCNSDAA